MFAERAIIDYRLSFADKGKLTLFSVPVCRKQTEDCCFCFPFVAKKWKLPFFASSFFSVSIYYITVYIYIYIYVKKRKTEAQRIFLNLFTIDSSCKQKFVFFPFVGEETSGSYPFANVLNGLKGLAHLHMNMYSPQRFGMNVGWRYTILFPLCSYYRYYYTRSFAHKK